MNWITVVWSINAGACLTLGVIYLVVWCKQRESWVHLLFSCIAVAAAAIAIFEFQLLQADTPAEYGALMRWRYVPVWVLVVSLVGFARLYLRAGRSWLAWSACGLKTLALILNFVFTPNLQYREITALRHLPWGGEMASVPQGTPNPWSLLGQVTLMLFLAFFIDATITVWRRGERQRALLVGGSIIFFATIVAAQVALVIWGVIQIPFFSGFAYLGIVASLAYQLSDDTVRAARLARALELSEATLRQREEQMELASSSGELFMWTWDIPRDEVWLSEKGRALFGFSQGEKLNAARIRSAIHPDDREFVCKLVENSLTTAEEVQGEYRIVLGDGSVRWITRRGRVEFNGDGHPAWERGVLMDITERKEAEEQFRRVVEAAPSAMIMVDKEGRITLANAQAEKTFGYPREELLGHSIEMLVPERLRPGHRGFRHGYLCDPQARPMGAGRELFGRRKDGSQVPVEIGLNPIHTSKGLFVLVSIVDISERKQSELEAARQRHDLAHLARVAMLGELSSSLAHELTHPLTAILSNAQAAQRFLASENVDLKELREILNDIVAEDQRAGEVIHRLRLLLKKGEPQKHCDDVDVNAKIHNVLKLMRHDLINHNVTVDTDLAQNLPPVAGDRVQLQQVLLNLVLNGCEAMTDNDSSERRLLISSKLEDGEVRVSVTDRGGSIPEEKKEQVFDRFFTTKKEGMGLGLSVCRTIINAHRGKIWATNNADHGATFHFSLPIVPVVRSEKEAVIIE